MQLGFKNVDESGSGMETLMKIERALIVDGAPYQVILLDWNMPDVDGLTILKKIKTNESLKDTSVIMVTAERNSEQVVEAAHSGVNGYVVKPFSSNEIKTKLETTLKVKL
jgi:two-component system chemotaxis response regulator CheY